MANNSLKTSDSELNKVIDRLITHFSDQIDTLWDKLVETRKNELQSIDDNFNSIKETINELMQDKASNSPAKK